MEWRKIGPDRVPAVGFYTWISFFCPDLISCVHCQKMLLANLVIYVQYLKAKPKNKFGIKCYFLSKKTFKPVKKD